MSSMSSPHPSSRSSRHSTTKSPNSASPRRSPTRSPTRLSPKQYIGHKSSSSKNSSMDSSQGNQVHLHEPHSESFTIDSPINSIFNTLNESRSKSGHVLSGLTHILDLPIRITKLIFTFIPLEDLLACMLTCSAWYNVLGDENIKVWKINCYDRMKKDVINSDHLKLCPTYKSKIRALTHAWNPYDCSENATIVDHFTFQRNQIPQTSDGCRGKIGFREGRHVWQIIWQDPLGSAAVIGVATRSTVMNKPGYIPLLGHDRHSWGWNLVNNVLIHKGDSHSYYPLDPKIRYKVGEVIHVLLDCDERTLSFKKNGQFLGVAFRDLPVPKKDLYPSISSVYGGTRVTMVYLGNIPSENIIRMTS